MPKQRKPSPQTFLYFQTQTSPLADLQEQTRRWWREQTSHYRPLARIEAASFSEAAVLMDAGAWQTRGVKLLVDAPPRPARQGDVLLHEDVWNARSYWMRRGAAWMELPAPDDLAVQREQHAVPIKSVACSPDGLRVAATDRDDLIRLHTCLRRDEAVYSRHHGDVRALAWSPDGRRIASGDWSNELHFWQVSAQMRHQAETERVLICLVEQPYNGEGISALAWSPDSRFVATGSTHGKMRLWDATTGRCIWTQLCRQDQAVCGLGWSPDRSRLVTGCSDGTVQVWLVERQQVWYSYDIEAGQEPIRAFASSPDGLQAALGGPGGLFHLDLNTGKGTRLPLAIYGLQSGVHSVTFAPDDCLLAAGCADGSVQVIDLKRKEVVHAYHGHNQAISAIVWSADGSRIVSGGQDRLVQVWPTRPSLSVESE